MSNQSKTILVQNQPIKTKVYLILSILATLLLCVICSNILIALFSIYQVITAFQALLITVIFTIATFCFYASILSSSLRYWSISKDELIIVDPQTLIDHFKLILSAFTRIKPAASCTIPVKEIQSIKMDASVNQRLGLMFGKPGHYLLVRIKTQDGIITIPNFVYYQESNFADAIQFMQQNGIELQDPYHLLEAIKNKQSINDILNKGDAQ